MQIDASKVTHAMLNHCNNRICETIQIFSTFVVWGQCEMELLLHQYNFLFSFQNCYINPPLRETLLVIDPHLNSYYFLVATVISALGHAWFSNKSLRTEQRTGIGHSLPLNVIHIYQRSSYSCQAVFYTTIFRDKSNNCAKHISKITSSHSACDAIAIGNALRALGFFI